MQEFNTIEEAFRWFLENKFPELPTEDKIALRDAKYCFYKEGKKVSEKRMKRIMTQYTSFNIVFRIDD